MDPISDGRRIVKSQPISCGFTLVELLVVIGIIAVLISLLLPALARVRQQSQRAVCETRLHNIMLASAVHRADHKDYYPITGLVTGGQPSELDDSSSQKYDYLSTVTGSGFPLIPTGDGSTINSVLAPITMALGAEMGFKSMLLQPLEQVQNGTVDMTGLTRCFFCPSHCLTIQDFTALESWNTYIVVINHVTGNAPLYVYEQISASSYCFNEYVLGFDDNYSRLRGHASQVTLPAQTMYACDGTCDKARPGFNGGFFTIYNNFPTPTTPAPNGGMVRMSDVLLASPYTGGIPLGGSTDNFDTKRHQTKMNIAFCDGHVETRNITANDLKTVYLVPPSH